MNEKHLDEIIDLNLSINCILPEVDKERLAEAIRELASAAQITIELATVKIFEALRAIQSAAQREELRLTSQRLEAITEMVKYRKQNNFIKNKINQQKAKWQR